MTFVTPLFKRSCYVTCIQAFSRDSLGCLPNFGLAFPPSVIRAATMERFGRIMNVRNWHLSQQVLQGG